jgi:hypothetical protein
MDLLDFYRDVKLQNSIINGFFETRKDDQPAYPSSSVESLSYFITNMMNNTIAYNMHYLEEQEEICYKCIYHRMDMARKAITRYMILENEDLGEYEFILTNTREKLNEWCKFINTNFDMKSKEEHCHIENSSFQLIQLEIDEDEDDED